MKRILLLVLSLGLIAAAATPVKVWQGKLALPVSEEALPDPNPPFDVFATTRFNYPYTLRTQMTGRRVDADLRALFLENEYLKCSVLPDIGGHLYSCTDKISGREMFYANPSLKKQLIGYRGAWAAFGIEFNFPVSHNWMSMSPVDFATAQNPDGSASVTVGNIDRPYGMQWRVELILRPGSTVLEERVSLYNHSDARRRYYWWNNAAAEVGDDSRIAYPMRFSASHGFTFVDTWPVNHEGLDLSVVKNQTAGPVSQFVHGSREPFMGVWHPRWNAGVVHYAEYGELPAKKIWSWGVDPDGLDWRRALSDNNSAYIEIQAGLFRNQETYAFLPPQTTTRFSEYWMPVRDTGGISRANLHGVVYMARDRGRLRVALNVNHAVPDARVRILDGSRVLDEARASLDPAKTFAREIDAPQGRKCTFELLDGAGARLLAHTEDTYDWTPEAEIKKGPQPERHLANPLQAGADQELDGALPVAMATYEQALRDAPDDFGLNRAAGRLAATLKNYDAAIAWLSRAQAKVSNDPETQYYLGLAFVGNGDDAHARPEFEGAQRQPQLRAAAKLQLAFLDARAGQTGKALEQVRSALLDEPLMVRAGAVEIALLRHVRNDDQARRQVAEWLARDPTSSALRYERTLLGAADPGLDGHLGSDPERVLEIAVDYINLGLYQDALDLLSRRYPPHDSLESEPGIPLPQDYALVRYYRGYCLEKLGRSPDAEYRAGSQASTHYVFPYRPTDLAVLRAALRRNPGDAVAHFYLGDILLSATMTDAAIAEWRTARSLKPDIPVLHRNLGRTLFALKKDDAAAFDVFREGIRTDRANVELYTGLDQVMSILGRSASERAAELERYPDRAAMPGPLALELALTYAEAGRFDDAENMFRNRYFEREEGGANVREVYVEVELRRAMALAEAGRRDEARAILAKLGSPVQGLDFTRDGMEPYLATARAQYLRGEIEKKLGDDAAARASWDKARAGRGIFSVLAARELGSADWKDLAERSGTARAGASVERGFALMALGRTAQAREVLYEVLRQPDRNLSHYLARRALALSHEPRP